MKKIVYLTDLYYPAKGRAYYQEDLMITAFLKDYFDIALCHPLHSQSFEDASDLIVFRNTGPVSGFREEYEAFRNRIRNKNLKTFNEFTGKADMAGKQYLIDLTKESYPVIPTVDSLRQLSALPSADRYVVKPKDGADSIGLEFLSATEVADRDFSSGNLLIQPAVDFLYEVSFYFINDQFEYAMYAPDTQQRWNLVPYEASEEDIEFARQFIQWNSIHYGIQRVDACRTKDGQLLLVELEDLNPYLSISLLTEQKRTSFLNHFLNALYDCLQ